MQFAQRNGKNDVIIAQRNGKIGVIIAQRNGKNMCSMYSTLPSIFLKNYFLFFDVPFSPAGSIFLMSLYASLKPDLTISAFSIPS